jgi:hypothetical protein
MDVSSSLTGKLLYHSLRSLLMLIFFSGGKNEATHKTGGKLHSESAADQKSEDASVRALLANYRAKKPLALVIDDKYTLFPYSLIKKGVTYAILGFYTITAAWAERQPEKVSEGSGSIVRFKFAFRWCDGQVNSLALSVAWSLTNLQGDPWWCQNSLPPLYQPTLNEPSSDIVSLSFPSTSSLVQTGDDQQPQGYVTSVSQG